jgi:hypothetical protein
VTISFLNRFSACRNLQQVPHRLLVIVPDRSLVDHISDTLPRWKAPSVLGPWLATSWKNIVSAKAASTLVPGGTTPSELQELIDAT